MKYCLEVNGWKTPATSYPLKKLKSAKIERSKEKSGYYRMEGVGGYVLYHHQKPIQITTLSIDNKVWMVDDPLYWHGMQSLAKHCKDEKYTHTLIGGLGLGLIVHALKQHTKNTNITVCEINNDVIKLIKPLLPKDKRIKITNMNILDITPSRVDTVILDLWVGEGTSSMKNEMLQAFALMKKRFSNANVYIWGAGDSWLNPAVDEEVRRKIPNIYWE